MKLDDRMKELIAMEVSITTSWHPCLQYHLIKARESGIAEQEIIEAIEVGEMMRLGEASKLDQFVSSLAQTVHSLANNPKKRVVDEALRNISCCMHMHECLAICHFLALFNINAGLA